MPISTDPIIFPCGMSRSGTTLLATILDSHSQISMGYELIPPPLPGPSKLLAILECAMELSGGDFALCGKALRNTEWSQVGMFFTRCLRAGLHEEACLYVLQLAHLEGQGDIRSLRDRLYMAWMIARESARRRERTNYGFKLNIPSVKKAFEFFPNSKLIYILRDPRDVLASHIERKFDRTVSEIGNAWNNYIRSFLSFRDNYPEAGLIIRYEDIVSSPEVILHAIFKFLGLPMEKSVLEFYKSKAGVHTYGHPNAENLRKDFFTTSIGRWQAELDINQVTDIEELCGAIMTEYRYKKPL
jgi:hypothetical protein